MFAHVFEHFDGDGGIGPGGGGDGFEADLWMLVVRQAKEVLVSAGKIFRPVAEKMGGSRPGVIVAVGGDVHEKLRVDPSPLLMEPERFGEMLSMIWIRGIERSQPFLERGPEGFFREIPKGAASAVTGAVFVGFEKIEQFCGASADDLGRWVQRTILPVTPAWCAKP